MEHAMRFQSVSPDWLDIAADEPITGDESLCYSEDKLIA
jgi:hypothetical protein